MQFYLWRHNCQVCESLPQVKSVPILWHVNVIKNKGFLKPNIDSSCAIVFLSEVEISFLSIQSESLMKWERKFFMFYFELWVEQQFGDLSMKSLHYFWSGNTRHSFLANFDLIKIVSFYGSKQIKEEWLNCKR